MKLSQVGELYLLDRIRKHFEKKSKNVLVGIGDDAAVVNPLTGNLVITTDMMIEDVHFDLSYITPQQLGFKLISVNVSDIYAMGGSPLYALLNIALRRDTKLEFVDSFLDGIKSAADYYGVTLVGGDVSATRRASSFSATLIGCVKRYIRRSGACIGDKIYVTGNLGNSACGLRILKKIGRPVNIEVKHSVKNKKPMSTKPETQENKHSSINSTWLNFFKGLSWETIEPLLRRHLLPEARLPNKFLKYATSMIDISDGLLIDLTRLCEESSIGAKIFVENIPISPELKKTAESLRVSALKLALTGGEDYELLFTYPPGKNVNAKCIGEIIESGRFIVDPFGRQKTFSAEGYQHF